MWPWLQDTSFMEFSLPQPRERRPALDFLNTAVHICQSFLSENTQLKVTQWALFSAGFRRSARFGMIAAGIDVINNEAKCIAFKKETRRRAERETGENKSEREHIGLF